MEQNQPRMKLVDQMIVFILSSIFMFFLDISTRESKGVNALTMVTMGRTQEPCYFPTLLLNVNQYTNKFPSLLVTLLLFKSPRVEVICDKGEISNSVHTH